MSKKLFYVKDTARNNKLYGFLTLKQCNNFCDKFERPQDLVGVDVR